MLVILSKDSRIGNNVGTEKNGWQKVQENAQGREELVGEFLSGNQLGNGMGEVHIAKDANEHT